MGLLKIILLCTSLVLTACNQGSKAGDKKAIIKKTDPNRTCVPEGELLAANITGGQLVLQADVDAKAVMMLVSNAQLCTAAAIGKKILLTAAHCIAGNKSNTYVAFYSSVSCESGYNKNKHIMRIAGTIVHEDYNGDTTAKAEDLRADIALVILEEEIPAGYAIYKIADPDKISSTADMYLYGYGRSGSNEGGVGMLRKTMLNHSLYKFKMADKKVEINQTGGSGICQGDSGGPSLVNVEGELQVLGVNSYVVGPKGNACSEYGYQTLVSSYKDWIDYKLLVYENKK